MQRVMVVGASGVLGRLISQELLRQFQEIQLVVSDYKRDRGERLAASLGDGVSFSFVDVQDQSSILQAVKQVDIVIVAIEQEEPHIQEACINHKVLCIDVTVASKFIQKVQKLDQAAKKQGVGSIVMSGFIPGLSGVMVKEAISSFTEIKEVHVGLLQNTNAKTGASGIIDMLKIISQDVYTSHELHAKSTVPGFTVKRKMVFEKRVDHANPSVQREVRLIEHTERQELKKWLGIEHVYFWTAWNKSSFNILMSVLKRMGIVSLLTRLKNRAIVSKMSKHDPNQPEHAYLSVEVQGFVNRKPKVKTVALSTFSDYHTTAIFTAALAILAGKQEILGVTFPFQVVDMNRILSQMQEKEIVLEMNME
ncbi:saccharopine dehydrogenase NADP-binding domain-containing protein [Bacillus horti]|uniref:Saccharopine dehydrogenase-like NADP-dependent oxidoreductase n=1 Tax=Caldalkalibacillus horti TaxID=77523 RepID=A0ABT9VV46_9BACI|nr:saccharopine dehydrogenase NADP-binding domain-containing protein [Bacillus horti]MDQ0164859.1 saccharopine dehydrogenase-like NADP-dependent oxidoreductase [Bacillus horti]